MAFCLPQEYANKFLSSIANGKINPEELNAMSSAKRREFFSGIVGKENASEVNAAFEKTMLLKNQKAGMVTWAKNISGIKEPARRDIIARIGRMENILEADDMERFLEDLASSKLGVRVSYEEAQVIAAYSKKISQLREGLDTATDAQRLEYGANQVALKNFVDDIKVKSNQTTLANLRTQLKDPGTFIKERAIDVAGFAKSAAASLDNSLWFRQGLKLIVLKPHIWAKDFAKSWVDMGKQVFRSSNDQRIIDSILTDIWARDNAINGAYQKAKLDIGITEEAYPTSLPARVPILGRLFKASEVAYTGGAYRLRADTFDSYYKALKDSGADMTDQKLLEDLGKLVNSLTGRGHLGAAESIARPLNVFLFSPRNLKSQFDFLTAHSFQRGGVSPEIRKIAATNLAKVVGGIATVLAVAKNIDPDSVELDPRSSDFGKIRIGNTRFDVTGGMSSMITLMSRLITGETKSSRTDKVRSLTSGEYGADTGLDVFWRFWENKFSPAATAFKNYKLTGETFSGEEATLPKVIEEAITPIIIQNYDELTTTRGAANVWIAMILDALGIATNTYE